jgi:hypothetical protein
MNFIFILLCELFYYENMMKWNVILFLEFLFIMYFEVQVLVLWNNHEFGVLMNGNVKNVEN